MRALDGLLFGMLVGCTLSGQVVESPMTVAPGAWLIEADVAAGAWDRSHAHGHQRISRFGAILLTTGVGDGVDVQIGFDGWSEERSGTPGQVNRADEWGDGWVRAKWNFSGDEAEGPAWALLPYAKVPMHEGQWEPGVVLIYGQPLSEDTWVEAMASLDWVERAAGGRESLGFAGVVWGRNYHQVGDIYAEALVEWNDAGDVPLTMGIGLARPWSERFSIDVEVLFGLTGPAPDLGAALRIVWAL
ncbi:hypothetical protein [Synoicihabitans lomoniglobus]|uniref:Transporter n=1 Tax=Synoicihabitans lomoniglobus TaxID=2909285 RepID=A0AAF0CSD5_9BACT|nr:hypothetical protein [Opitutaceae bacterium LMO-M01]WED67162.1 hypothetical protein PXH66_09890 [Opitutaceae bacterium LMO-M01]